MRTKIIFDYEFDYETKTGFQLLKIANNCKCPLYKSFRRDSLLTNIILKKENDFVFAEFEVKKEWYNLYPILGYGITDRFERGISFEFFEICALTDVGINPNRKVKSIGEQIALYPSFTF